MMHATPLTSSISGYVEEVYKSSGGRCSGGAVAQAQFELGMKPVLLNAKGGDGKCLKYVNMKKYQN